MTGTLRTSGIPRVSVLMTVYNAAPFLRTSIDSLMAQRFPGWELIVVENGSTDGSASILAGYADPRIHVIPVAENIGRTPALRRAFDCARGEYIAVLDADDVSHPERLSQQVTFLDKYPEAVLVGSWAQYIDERGKVIAEFKPPVNQYELQDCLGWINPIVHSSAMYRRRLALEVGGYPEDLVYAQDFGLVLALAQRSKIAMIDDFLCQLRVRSSRMTSSAKYQVIVAREAMILARRASDLLPLSARSRRLNRRAIAIAAIKLGIATLRAGCILSGLRLILHGLAKGPSAVWANGVVANLIGKRKFVSTKRIR